MHCTAEALEAAAAGGQRPPALPPLRVRVRRAWSPQDVAPLARICAEVFKPTEPSSSRAPGGLEAWQGLLTPPCTEDAWQKQIATALGGKQAAEAASREYRRRRRLQAVAAAAAAGEPPPPPGGWGETPEQRTQVQRWRRQRHFLLFLAQDAASGEVVGTAALTLAQPEARLPPPFPSASPRRAYCSNMAVVPAARRRGVGSALLGACERAARRWRHDALYLHVDSDNGAAVQLYQERGYEEVRRGAPATGSRRCLLRKPLRPRRGAAPGGGAAAGSQHQDGAAVGGRLGSSGVFVWEVRERGDGTQG
eukprot:scaffold4.g4928.t1